jgi:uncharacterized protein (DUF1330 family)
MTTSFPSPPTFAGAKLLSHARGDANEGRWTGQPLAMPQPRRARRRKEISMPAFWIARSRIIDPVEYKKYTDPLPNIFANYDARILARGGRYQVMEGPPKFQRFVVIEFPNFERGVACFTSPEYDHAAAFRRNGAGEVETVIVEGGDATR